VKNQAANRQFPFCCSIFKCQKVAAKGKKPIYGLFYNGQNQAENR